MLVDLSAATLGAPQSALDIDIAELLVACTVLVGPERGAGKAVETGGARPWRVSCRTCRGCADATPSRHRTLTRGWPEGSSSRCRQGHGSAGSPELAPLRRMRPGISWSRPPSCSRPTCSSVARADRVRHDRPRASSGRRGLDRRGSDPRPAHILILGPRSRFAVRSLLHLRCFHVSRSSRRSSSSI